MSNEQSDTWFRERADAFIHPANDQRRDADNDKVNACLLYAATRFDAFVVAAAAQDVVPMRDDKGEAVRYGTEKFRKG